MARVLRGGIGRPSWGKLKDRRMVLSPKRTGCALEAWEAWLRRGKRGEGKACATEAQLVTSGLWLGNKSKGGVGVSGHERAARALRRGTGTIE